MSLASTLGPWNHEVETLSNAGPCHSENKNIFQFILVELLIRHNVNITPCFFFFFFNVTGWELKTIFFFLDAVTPLTSRTQDLTNLSSQLKLV